MFQKSQTTYFSKYSFIQEINHELRGPVNTILAMVALSKKCNPEPKLQEYIESIQDASHTLLKCIDELIDLMKLEAGVKEFTRDPFDLEMIFEDLPMTKNYQGENGATNISFEIGEDIPFKFKGPAAELKTVVNKLLGFFLSHFRGYPIFIKVFHETTDSEKASLNISMEARECFFDTEAVNKIFLPFAKIPFPGSVDTTDYGISLALCRQIIEKCGGIITTCRIRENGVNISFSMPLSLDVTVSHKDERDKCLEGIRILIADSDPFTRNLVKQRLSSMRCHIKEVEESATGGEKYLERSALEEVDILLIDWITAGEEKLTFIKKLCESSDVHNGSVPIIVTQTPAVSVMGLSESKDTKQMNAHFLIKPLRLEALCSMILSLTEGGGQNEATDLDADTSESRCHEKSWLCLEGKRVLLVEDNEINQAIGLEILKKRGMKTVVASNGRNCLKAAQKGNFDIILMDIHLPDADGFSLTKKLRNMEKTKNIPIIAMTASTTDRKRCLDSGMNDFISKPVEPQALYDMIARWT